jgi:hypothetical protein
VKDERDEKWSKAVWYSAAANNSTVIGNNEISD